MLFSFIVHGIGLSLPSQVPGERPSTAPSSPPSSAPPSSSPPASSWPPPLPLGWSGPPWPRCTWPVLSLRKWRRGGGIVPQLFLEDALTLASQLSGRYERLLPQHKFGRVHVDPPSLRPNCRPQKSAARQMIAASWPVDPPHSLVYHGVTCPASPTSCKLSVGCIFNTTTLSKITMYIGNYASQSHFSKNAIVCRAWTNIQNLPAYNNTFTSSSND